NCAVEVATHFDAMTLLRALREIEMKMGSKKLVAKGPRLIDVDILLYGSETVDTPELQVPHPRMHLRRFVLAPLAEIATEGVHAALKMTVAQLLERTTDHSAVRKLEYGHDISCPFGYIQRNSINWCAGAAGGAWRWAWPGGRRARVGRDDVLWF